VNLIHRRALTCGALFLFGGILCAVGQNLVPNGDFENYFATPGGPSGPNQATGWSSAGGTPDYFYTFNSLNSGFSAPTNGYGVEAPFSGNGYAGFLDSPYYAARNNTVQFEYLQAHLTGPMIVGQTYQVSLAVAFANKCVIASDGFGVNLSADTSFNQTNSHLFTQSP
jgi:hypothetical protein